MTSGRSKIHSLCPSRDLYSPHLTFQFTSEVQKVRPTKKMGRRKPSIVGTVRLFHRKLNLVKELKQELEYQIHSGLEPEVVSVTHDEFKRTMSQLDELVDQLTQSENVDAEDSLNDAACLTKLKVEVAQTVKKHELSFRNTSTRPSSASSSRSNQIPVPSAPESPGVVQSMRDTRQQQQINDLADQQSISNLITIHRQVQSAMGILQENSNRVISSDVQNSLQPSALEQTDSDNVASNQHQHLQAIAPIVNPAIVSQSSIDATCAFPQLSTASNMQLPVFIGTLPPAGNTFAPARPINNTGLFENVPDHRTPVPVSFGNRFPTPSHPGPFQAYCSNSWSNLANGSFEPSNATPRGPVYPSSQSLGNQNSNPYRQRNIHRSVKLPDI